MVGQMASLPGAICSRSLPALHAVQGTLLERTKRGAPRRSRARAGRHPSVGPRGEEGQALMEWILVFPLLTLLLLFVGLYGWWWWQQSTAAWAIHDGTHVAARAGGSVGEGLSVVQRELASALGGSAQRFSGHYSIAPGGAPRSIQGQIDVPQSMSVPFVGTTLFRVRASSVQRDERFYGGPPTGWW